MRQLFFIERDGNLVEGVITQLSESEGRYRLELDDEVLEFAATVVETGVRSGELCQLLLNVGNTLRDFAVVSDRDGTDVLSRGASFSVALLNEQALSRRAAASGASGSNGGAIQAPMPGKVVKVLVAVGSDVTAGQGVVVVEAMKMENELGSPANGQVAEILVHDGDSVEAGQPLAIVKCDSSG